MLYELLGRLADVAGDGFDGAKMVSYGRRGLKFSDLS